MFYIQEPNHAKEELLFMARDFISEWSRQTREAGFTTDPGPNKAWSAKTTACFERNAKQFLKDLNETLEHYR